jgi:hypothetical protein
MHEEKPKPLAPLTEGRQHGVSRPRCLQAEGAALDEDDQADGDQDHGQQDVTPSAESSGDDGAGGEKPPGDAPAPCGILCGCR